MRKWERLLSESFRSVSALAGRLGLGAEEERRLEEIGKRYPVCVPGYYLSLIDPADPSDPIRKMSIPGCLEASEGGSADTSGEADNTVVQGMQHKYPNTALILSTNQCAMYCRHCFRKRLVGLSSDEIASHLPDMAGYIKAHPEIDNVLVSGGDAFLNPDSRIRQYLRTLVPIPSIRFIRFGTRTPVTLPQRITEDDGEILDILREYSHTKPIIIVTQFNHPREITPEARKAITALIDAGCSVRNQTVLLRGVNDSAETLSDLMDSLVGAGAAPYYLFQCRPVEGVKNQFQVPIADGVRISEAAKRTMSGPAKAFRYAMSHPTGKIEILGPWRGSMLFRYHQAKRAEDSGRIFSRSISAECWFSDPDEIA